MFLDKYKLLCAQLIPISSNAKKQKSNTAVASESKNFFNTWISIIPYPSTFLRLSHLHQGFCVHYIPINNDGGMG